MKRQSFFFVLAGLFFILTFSCTSKHCREFKPSAWNKKNILKNAHAMDSLVAQSMLDKEDTAVHMQSPSVSMQRTVTRHDTVTSFTYNSPNESVDTLKWSETIRGRQAVFTVIRYTQEIGKTTKLVTHFLYQGCDIRDGSEYSTALHKQVQYWVQSW